MLSVTKSSNPKINSTSYLDILLIIAYIYTVHFQILQRSSPIELFV